MKNQQLFNQQEQTMLICELTNSMEFYDDANDFSGSLGFNQDQRSFLAFLFEQYWEIDAVQRMKNTDDDWKDFINECLNKHRK